MRTRVASAMTALLFLPVATASATEISFGGGTNSQGQPTLRPWAYPAGSGRIDTYVCPNGGTDCSGPRAWVVSDPGGTTVDIGDPAPGTVFEARYVDNGQVTATARTPAWMGTLTNRTPPAVTGDPVVGGTVSLTPGTWDGGWAAPWQAWGGDLLLACQDAAATTGCWYVAKTESLRLDARWTGYYLFGVSSRASGFPVPVSGEVAPPVPIGGITRSPTSVVSAPAGPVRAVTAEPLPQTAAPAAPKVTLRARALRAKGRLSLGRVTCAVPCKVKLAVAGRSTTFTVQGTKALTVAPRHGRLKVKVVVDGKTLANGVVRAR